MSSANNTKPRLRRRRLPRFGVRSSGYGRLGQRCPAARRTVLSSLLCLAAIASSCAAAYGADADRNLRPQSTTPELVANGALAMSPMFKSLNSDASFLAQTTGEVTWHHTVGVQRFRYPNGETLTRRVEAWITPDGRYRVKTSSLDGTQTSEEVAYDGHGTQLVLYTDPAGHQQALVIENDTHFAVTGSAGATNRQLRDSTGTGSNGRSGGFMTYEAGAINQGSGNISTFNIDVPAGVEIKDLDDVTSPPKESNSARVTRATGSNSEIMRNFLGYPCLRAYNYRDSSTTFFTGNSHIRGSCTLVAVSIWANYLGDSGGFAPPRCGLAFIAHEPDPSIGYLPTYVSWSGYFYVYPGERACSAHAGWDSDHTLQVSYRGLPASVTG